MSFFHLELKIIEKQLQKLKSKSVSPILYYWSFIIFLDLTINDSQKSVLDYICNTMYNLFQLFQFFVTLKR